MDANTLDRLLGCAVGAAVGDALGMPLEFYPPRPVDRLVRDFTPGRLPAGSFTDDTEMALALAESLVARRGWDGVDLAARFVAWYRADPPDVGNQTRAVLGWLESGLDWQSASLRAAESMPNSAGNGSVMRCWPVALAAWDDDSRLEQISAQQSQLTHPHPDCVSACVIVNRCIASLVSGATAHEALSAALRATPVSPLLLTTLRAAPSLPRERLENSGWVIHTLESAFWGLLTTRSFEEAVVQVANLGNDADTAASVTGALAGAAYGLKAIPAAWRAGLRGEWPLGSGQVWREPHLLALAEALIQVGEAPVI